jgi:hypothetical protein
MLDGLPKKKYTLCRRATKPTLVAQSQPMTEVTPEPKNAERSISLTELGRVRVVRHLQLMKSPSGICFTCDGVSNVTNDNLEHENRRKYPTVQTEEGTVKEVRLSHEQNARDAIIRTDAGDSKKISASCEQ